MSSNRIEALDSIRGLAALFVVFLHILLPLPLIYTMITEGSLDLLYSYSFSEMLLFLFVYSPLHIIWDGGAAVILFFVLSGFVLSLPYFNKKPIRYFPYITKRFFRIYIPYIMSLVVSFICIKLFKHEENIPELSDNFNSLWQSPITFQTVIDHLFMIGGTAGPGANVWNGVIWTLVHEFRISLVLPLIIFIIAKLNWKYALIAPILLFVISRYLLMIPTNEFLFGVFNTLFYSAFFTMGILVAKYLPKLKKIYINSSRKIKLLYIVFAILLYNWQWTLGFYTLINSERISFVISGVGSAMIIIIALSSNSIQKFLQRKALIQLGRISFSLYLIHGSVILTLVYSLHSIYPIYYILPFIPIISLIAASIFYKYVEIPSVNIGKKLSKYFL